MKELNRQEVKERLLVILKEFTRYCDENHLTYSLAYGTLIGAIRHKGFIPWDDDVDVWMPYPDYIKFLSEYKNNENFKLAHIGIDKSYRLPFARLTETGSFSYYRFLGKSYGVNIDIYPLCGIDVPHSFISAYKRISNLYQRYRDILQLTKILSIFHVSDLTLTKRYNLISDIVKEYAKYDYEKVDYVYSATGLFAMDKQLFKDTIEVEFEGCKYKAFSGYDAILRMRYGDYMKLPPKDQQIPHHGVQYFDKD